MSVKKTFEVEIESGYVVMPLEEANALINCMRFFQAAMQEGPWDGGDLDGWYAQELADSLGLIVSVPYDPEKHGAYNNYGCDAGDPWFEFSPVLKASLKRIDQATSNAETIEALEEEF